MESKIVQFIELFNKAFIKYTSCTHINTTTYTDILTLHKHYNAQNTMVHSSYRHYI